MGMIVRSQNDETGATNIRFRGSNLTTVFGPAVSLRDRDPLRPSALLHPNVLSVAQRQPTAASM